MDLTPTEIVRELDKHIVGQQAAKRAVAVALRNRTRRKRLPPEMAREVTPKNILMIGPTGVGKTEIARRLARLAGAPFLKVEATKFTEVGYVGRDVDSIVRDLAEASYQLVLSEMKSKVAERAQAQAEEEVAALLRVSALEVRSGRHHEQSVEIEVAEEAKLPFMGMMGGEQMQGLGEMLKGLMPGRRVRRKMRVKEALETLKNQEAERLVDKEEATQEALRRAQEEGIVFIDEMDKVARPRGNSSGPDVSGEGVQRDLLPVVEGTVVTTPLGAGFHRPRIVYRRRSFPYLQAQRPDSRTSGPLSHPGRTRAAGSSRVRAHPAGAGKLPHQAVQCPTGCRWHRGPLQPRGHWSGGPLRFSGQSGTRGYRSPPPGNRAGEGFGGNLISD